MSNKKKQQLGMNPSTASGRLSKDILWMLIQKTGQDVCVKCGDHMSREDFSIEHITPWLDSEDPVAMFFDLENIAFSHRSCNYSSKRTAPPANICGTVVKYLKGCRCSGCRMAKSEYAKDSYDPESRRDRYIRYEKKA